MSTLSGSNSYVSSKIEEKGVLKFTLSGINISIANGLRRTILSDIPVLAFKTFPHNENQAEFIVNTTRFNNEILKQRLGCIPINISNHSLPYNELVVEVHKKNDTNEMMYVTTEDFKIKNIKTDKYLEESTVRKIFPPNEITGDYILFARLRPKISNELPGEELKIRAKMSLHTAGEDGMYNCVSCCSYSYTQDKVKQNDAWQEKMNSLIAEHEKAKETAVADNLDDMENNFQEQLEMEEKDFYNHDAKRIFIKDSFDFKVESIGIFENEDICSKACDVILEKLSYIKEQIENDSILIEKSKNTMKNSFDIKLMNEGYTIGKIIDFVLFKQQYEENRNATFVGFRKEHPFDSYSYIRIAYNENLANITLDRPKQDAITACDTAIEIFTNIRNEFV